MAFEDECNFVAKFKAFCKSEADDDVLQVFFSVHLCIYKRDNFHDSLSLVHTLTWFSYKVERLPTNRWSHPWENAEFCVLSPIRKD